jgi:5S rRNA maturation endonuclease (ribonuclease M5)
LINTSLQQLAAALGGEVSGNQILAPGPNHGPKDRSLSVRLSDSAPEGFVVHSFAGDDPLACRDHVRQVGYGVPRWEPQKSGSSGTGAISRMSRRVSRNLPETERAGVQSLNTAKPTAKAGSPPAEYIYKLADGTPYLRVKRTPEKEFYQSHWNGSGWQNRAPDGPKIPYRLPDLIEAASNGVMDVVVVEGEKDADNLAALGFIATTNSGGADAGTGTKFTPELAEWFKDRNVYVLPDNDEPGERHATQVVETLRPVAKSIRVVRLPGLPDKGDVSDWIEAGGTADELADLLGRAPEIKDEAPASRFKFETFSDLQSLPPAEYLMDGWIPERSVGLLYGRWGTGKSFLGFDWCLHLAFGRPDWHGAKLPGVPCDVLIIAREGHAGFVKRVNAFMQYHGITEQPTNLRFMRSSISFLDETAFPALKEAIKALDQPFRFVLVDTVGRVLPGADMAKEAPITLFMERLQQVGEITGGTAVGVHHENKAGDANGSMFFQNSSDFMFSISREGEGPLKSGKITCVKQKEGDDGWSREITFAKVDLPDFKSSLVVEGISEESSSRSRKKATWPKGLRLFKDCIDAAILDASQTHQVGGDGPIVRVAPVGAARTIHGQRYVSSGEGDRAAAERQAWKRNLNAARDAGLISGAVVDGNELIWIVNDG